MEKNDLKVIIVISDKNEDGNVFANVKVSDMVYFGDIDSDGIENYSCRRELGG